MPQSSNQLGLVITASRAGGGCQHALGGVHFNEAESVFSRDLRRGSVAVLRGRVFSKYNECELVR